LDGVLGDTWYSREIGAATLEEVVGGWSRPFLRSRIARGAMLWWIGRKYPVVLTTLARIDTRVLLILERLFGRRGRYLVILEFIPVMSDGRNQWSSSSRTPDVVRRLFWGTFVAPVVQRCLLIGQTLASWEVERNATAFGLERERLVFVPWFGSVGIEQHVPPAMGRAGVLASGRAACDWETVFACANGATWPLTVVCSHRDLPRVSALNANQRATVLCEITPEAHARQMRQAAVYLLALREADVSSGQIRVMDAAAAGTPLVASEVRGLLDYVTPGETALTFPAGDGAAARRAVALLYEDAALSRKVAEAAWRRGVAWSREDYLGAIRDLVDRARAEAQERQVGPDSSPRR
jgi:hypothetical protein